MYNDLGWSRIMAYPKDIPEKSDQTSPHGNHTDDPCLESHDRGQKDIMCPLCGYSFITESNGKHKLRTRILVFIDNGNTMGICPQCKAQLKVPVSIERV